ncbi:MAG: MFS transporter [Acidimicrobiia bacterium]
MREKPARRERTPLPKGFSVLWTTVAIDITGFGIAIPVLGLFAKREFGASAFQVGLLIATYSLAQFLLAPVWGRISDRIGRKPVIVVALFGTAVGALITGAAGALWMLFLGRLIDGGSGASIAVAQAAATDLAEPHERPRLLGLLGAAFGVGFSLGPAIAGIAAVIGGARAPFFVASALALLNAAAAIKRMPETRRHDTEIERHLVPELSGSLRRSGVVRLATISFIGMVAFSGFEATMALLGERRFSLDEAGVAWVFVGVGLALVFVQGAMVPRVVPRIGAAMAVRSGYALDVAGLALLAVANNWPVLVLSLALLVVGQGLAGPSLTTLIANRAGNRDRGKALGVQQSFNAASRIVGPAAAGALFEHVSVGAPYAIGSIVMFLAFVRLLAERDDSPATVPAH